LKTLGLDTEANFEDTWSWYGKLMVLRCHRIYSFELKLHFDATSLFLSYLHFMDRIKWHPQLHICATSSLDQFVSMAE